MPAKATSAKKSKNSQNTQVSSKDTQESSQKIPETPLPQAVPQNDTILTQNENLENPINNEARKRKTADPTQKDINNATQNITQEAQTIQTNPTVHIDNIENISFSEEELNDLYTHSEIFIRKVHSKSQVIFKNIIDQFSIYGDIDIENSFVKKVDQESIVDIAFKNENGFTKSKSFESTESLYINQNDLPHNKERANIFYRIVAMIPNNPYPTLEQIRDGFSPDEELTERIALKKEKSLAVIYLKTKELFISYIPGEPIHLTEGSINPIPSLAATNNPNLTKLIISNLPFKTDNLKVMTLWAKIKSKKALNSIPIYGGIIRTSNNIPTKRIFYWFNTNDEIKGLDGVKINIMNQQVLFETE